MQEEAPGMVFGTMMVGQFFANQKLFVRTELKEYDYQEVKGPFMMDRVLWENGIGGTEVTSECLLHHRENRKLCDLPDELPWDT